MIGGVLAFVMSAAAVLAVSGGIVLAGAWRAREHDRAAHVALGSAVGLAMLVGGCALALAGVAADRGWSW